MKNNYLPYNLKGITRYCGVANVFAQKSRETLIKCCSHPDLAYIQSRVDY